MFLNSFIGSVFAASGTRFGRRLALAQTGQRHSGQVASGGRVRLGHEAARVRPHGVAAFSVPLQDDGRLRLERAVQHLRRCFAECRSRGYGRLPVPPHRKGPAAERPNFSVSVPFALSECKWSPGLLLSTCLATQPLIFRDRRRSRLPLRQSTRRQQWRI